MSISLVGNGRQPLLIIINISHVSPRDQYSAAFRPNVDASSNKLCNGACNKLNVICMSHVAIYINYRINRIETPLTTTLI